jgi:hypothetical protein
VNYPKSELLKSSQIVWDRKKGTLVFQIEVTAKVRWESGWHYSETDKAIWAELLPVHGTTIQTDSIRQQFSCHVLGGIAGASVNNETWDLEFNRPSNNSWILGFPAAIEARDPGQLCNWE